MLERRVAYLFIAVITIAGVFVPSDVNAQIRTVQPVPASTSARLARLGRVKPGYISHLVAIRQCGLTAGTSFVLKNRKLRQHVKGLAQKAPGQDVEVSQLEDSFTGIGHVWHTNEAVFSVNCARLTLERGELLIHVAQPAVILFGEHKVLLKPGTLVVVERNSEKSRLVNLADTKRNSCKVMTAQTNLLIGPGMEYLISPCEGSLSLCQGDNCGRRATTCMQFRDGLAQACEVSLPSLLKSHRLLRGINKRGMNDDKRVIDKVLKMTACLAHLNKSQEPYRWKSSAIAASQ